MSCFPQRWLCAFGALVMGMGLMLLGCTEAMVGPADADAPDTRTIEALDIEPLEHTAPLDANVDYDEQGRIVIRFFELPPGNDLPTDTLGSPGDTTFFDPITRIRVPYSAPFELPMDTTFVPADTTGNNDAS